MTARDELTGQGDLLLGTGFAFGVTVALCPLAVVPVAVTRVPATTGEIAASPLPASDAGGSSSPPPSVPA